MVRRAPQRTRIVDVARLAGVSTQTVSNVINGRGGFTEATRAKVESAISELDFQPNRYAQSLRSLRTMLIGFDLSGTQLDVTNPFALTFLRDLVVAAEGSGYRVVVFAHDRTSPDGFRSTVAAREVDGFVLSDSPADDMRSRVLAAAGIPYVTFGRTAPDLPGQSVDIDNRVAMHAAVDHLVAKGYGSFGYIGYPNDVYWNSDRLAGTQERLREHGFDLPEATTWTASADGMRELIDRVLRRPDRPQAILTSSDSIAVRVVTAAASMGVVVGRDLAVTGFDAGPLRTMVEPALTSIRIPVTPIAEALVTMLVRALNGTPTRSTLLVPTELVLGAST